MYTSHAFTVLVSTIHILHSSTTAASRIYLTYTGAPAPPPFLDITSARYIPIFRYVLFGPFNLNLLSSPN